MHMNVTEPRGFVFTQSFMSLRLSLATGLGASVERPSSLTVVVVGEDGRLLMSLGELDSLVAQSRDGAPILVVVIDDGAYGAEVHHFAPLGEPTDIVEHGTRVFLGVATALGAQGRVVRSSKDPPGASRHGCPAPRASSSSTARSTAPSWRSGPKKRSGATPINPAVGRYLGWSGAWWRGV
jgi:thiamine pyrophosphate-dependent acetolactate synthase large subunit-like protein